MINEKNVCNENEKNEQLVADHIMGCFVQTTVHIARNINHFYFVISNSDFIQKKLNFKLLQ